MVYVFDLDGTLCFCGKEIHPQIISQLQRIEAEGNSLVFASARPIRDMLPLLNEHFSQHFLIGGNGSIISQKGKIEVVKPLAEEDYLTLKALISKYEVDYLVDSHWNYSLQNRNDALANINSKVDALKLANNLPLDDIGTCIKCNLLNIPETLYEELIQAVDELDVVKIIHSGSQSIDIVAKGINKYETFMKYFGVTDYAAFGNDNNDIELLENAKFGVCVGDNPNAQRVADQVIEASNESVVEFLKAFKLTE